jgi:hypothetical protein
MRCVRLTARAIWASHESGDVLNVPFRPLALLELGLQLVQQLIEPREISFMQPAQNLQLVGWWRRRSRTRQQDQAGGSASTDQADGGDNSPDGPFAETSRRRPPGRLWR